MSWIGFVILPVSRYQWESSQARKDSSCHLPLATKLVARQDICFQDVNKLYAWWPQSRPHSPQPSLTKSQEFLAVGKLALACAMFLSGIATATIQYQLLLLRLLLPQTMTMTMTYDNARCLSDSKLRVREARSQPPNHHSDNNILWETLCDRDFLLAQPHLAICFVRLVAGTGCIICALSVQSKSKSSCWQNVVESVESGVLSLLTCPESWHILIHCSTLNSMICIRTNESMNLQNCSKNKVNVTSHSHSESNRGWMKWTVCQSVSVRV